MSSHLLADFWKHPPQPWRRRTRIPRTLSQQDQRRNRRGRKPGSGARTRRTLPHPGGTRRLRRTQYLVADGPTTPKTGEPYGKATRAYAEWLASQDARCLRLDVPLRCRQNLSEMPCRKSVATARLQICLECTGFLLCFEGDIGFDFPGLIGRSMRNTTLTVLGQTRFQVGRETDITLIRAQDAAENISVKHTERMGIEWGIKIPSMQTQGRPKE